MGERSVAHMRRTGWEHVGRMGDVRATGVSFHLEDRRWPAQTGVTVGLPQRLDAAPYK